MPSTYGQDQYGLTGYGGGLLAAGAPAVTLTSPSGAQAPNPSANVTAAWTYVGDSPQATFRVRVVDTATGLITYYDSGVVSSAAVSFTFSTFGTSIPTNTSGSQLTAILNITDTLGLAPLAASVLSLPFDLTWGTVTAGITAPTSATLSGATIPVTWTYSSSTGILMGGFRVQLVSPDNSLLVFFDSGQINTAGVLYTSYTINYLISGGTRYKILLTLESMSGSFGTSSFTFTGLQSDPSQIADNKDVGTMWACAINGYGFVMLEDPTVPHWYKQIYMRVSNMIDAGARLVTSDTPFTNAADRYSFSAGYDFRSGAGQTYLDRPDSVANRYLDSEGVDPFNKYQLKLLPTTTNVAATTYAASQAVVVNGVLYQVTGTNQITSYTSPGSGSTVFTIAACTGTITDMTTDGKYWYVCSPQGVFRGSTAADPGAAWSTPAGAVSYQALSWAGQRICLSFSSSANSVWTTLTDGGVEEVVGGRLKLPLTWVIGKATGGTGHIWFPASFGTEGNTIYSWDLVTGNAPTPAAMPLLGGEVPKAVFWYAGSVMVAVDYGTQTILYRCTVDSSTGSLSPNFVTDTLPATGSGRFAFMGSGRRIYFSWQNMTASLGYCGIGALDITTGGYCKWMASSVTGSHPVNSIVYWSGKVGFAVSGTGLFLQQTSFVASGFLTTSVSDKGTAIQKAFDTVEMTCLPLGSGETVTVDYSVDGAVSYLPITAATMSGAGVQTVKASIGGSGSSLSFRITLISSILTTPTFYLLQSRFHFIGLGDSLIVIPISCNDEISAMNGRPAPFNAPGVGFARAKMLESWVGQRVKFQDQDWLYTKTSEVLEVHDVEVRGLSTFSPHNGRMNNGAVAIVTLIKRVA